MKFHSLKGPEYKLNMLLFVNSCSRPKGISRTFTLCDSFINKYAELHDDIEIVRRDLFEEDIHYLSPSQAEAREKLIAEENYEDPMFRLAREASQADEILIGAPCWDLSFPAVLKAYIENICVNGLTFHYTATGSEGMCAAKRLIYITTAGGFIGEASPGSSYVRAIGEFLGIKDYLFLSAEGLDICEADTPEIMKKAMERAENAAASL